MIVSLSETKFQFLKQKGYTEEFIPNHILHITYETKVVVCSKTIAKLEK